MSKVLKVSAKARNDVLPGNRSFQQGSHIIFYKTASAIEIIRVLHERMDVEKHFQ